MENIQKVPALYPSQSEPFMVYVEEEGKSGSRKNKQGTIAAYVDSLGPGGGRADSGYIWVVKPIELS